MEIEGWQQGRVAVVARATTSSTPADYRRGNDWPATTALTVCNTWQHSKRHQTKTCTMAMTVMNMKIDDEKTMTTTHAQHA